MFTSLAQQRQDGLCPDQRFQESNYIVKRLGEGQFAKVYASIPKDVAKAVLSEHRNDRAAACQALRRVLEAGKVVVPYSDRGGRGQDLSGEISALSRIAPYQVPTITKLRRYDNQAAKVWYTMDLLEGASLYEFLEANRPFTLSPTVPVALAWHTVLRLTEALLFLHFGMEVGNTKVDLQVSDWQALCHRDISEGNIFFCRPCQETAYRDYPEVKLIDFGGRNGEVEQLPAPMKDCTDEQLNRMFLFQREDAYRIHSALLRFLALMRNHRQEDEIEQSFSTINSASLGGRENAVLKSELLRLVVKARQRRGALYAPLSANLRSYFTRTTVTDQELVACFEQLVSGSSARDLHR